MTFLKDHNTWRALLSKLPFRSNHPPPAPRPRLKAKFLVLMPQLRPRSKRTTPTESPRQSQELVVNDRSKKDVQATQQEQIRTTEEPYHGGEPLDNVEIADPGMRRVDADIAAALDAILENQGIVGEDIFAVATDAADVVDVGINGIDEEAIG